MGGESTAPAHFENWHNLVVLVVVVYRESLLVGEEEILHQAYSIGHRLHQFVVALIRPTGLVLLGHYDGGGYFTRVDLEATDVLLPVQEGGSNVGIFFFGLDTQPIHVSRVSPMVWLTGADI